MLLFICTCTTFIICHRNLLENVLLVIFRKVKLLRPIRAKLYDVLAY